MRGWMREETNRREERRGGKELKGDGMRRGDEQIGEKEEQMRGREEMRRTGRRGRR